jgi:serine/threonine-protein kinase
MSDWLAPASDTLLARYAIERELGRGGMATVYLAEDLKLQHKVALKLLDEACGALARLAGLRDST